MKNSILEGRGPKAILIVIRFVFLAMIASLALPAWIEGKLSWILPFVLALYLATNITLVIERNTVIGRPRVQAVLILFDIAVLLLSLMYLNQHKYELLFMMAWVVLISTAGQRLWLTVAGFAAVAGLFLWFTIAREGFGGVWHSSVPAWLTVLWVIGLYVGYVSESASRERAHRQDVERRLNQEIACLHRKRDLANGME